jgi:hypothetical protein
MKRARTFIHLDAYVALLFRVVTVLGIVNDFTCIHTAHVQGEPFSATLRTVAASLQTIDPVCPSSKRRKPFMREFKRVFIVVVIII